MSSTIKRQDIQVGDTIKITRTVEVKQVRNTEHGMTQKPVTVITYGQDGYPADTLMLSDDSPTEITLEKRHVKIPLDALIVSFTVDEGDLRVFLHRDSLSDKFKDAVDDSLYSLEEVRNHVSTGREFGKVDPGSLETLKYEKPKLAQGGFATRVPIFTSKAFPAGLSDASIRRAVAAQESYLAAQRISGRQ